VLAQPEGPRTDPADAAGPERGSTCRVPTRGGHASGSAAPRLRTVPAGRPRADAHECGPVRPKRSAVLRCPRGGRPGGRPPSDDRVVARPSKGSPRSCVTGASTPPRSTRRWTISLCAPLRGHGREVRHERPAPDPSGLPLPSAFPGPQAGARRSSASGLRRVPRQVRESFHHRPEDALPLTHPRQQPYIYCDADVPTVTGIHRAGSPPSPQ